MPRSIADLLLTAKQPLGNTMYVWGGGWNEEDTGAGWEARTIGVSPCWKAFADKQDSQYDFRKTRYQIHHGLDCSGYVGWVVYNVLEQVSGKEGYVMPATCMAWEFAGRGLGQFTPAEYVTDWKAGDIMSMKGHVWIALGMCRDKSVVLLHASPPGVSLCGTILSVPSDSQAVKLANSYMKEYYPQWYERYPDCSRDSSYLKRSSRMRWHRHVLSDDEKLTDQAAEQVLEYMFSK